MEETGDLLEDSWFFRNLLNTKPRTISRCYSDLASNACPYPHPSLCSTQDHVINNERKNSSFSSRKQPLVAPISLTRRPSLPTSIETQSFLMEKPKMRPNLTPSFAVGSDQQDAMVKNELKRSNWTPASSRSTSIDESDQEDEDDHESEFTLGRLIRQASMNYSHATNPPGQTPKPMTENMLKKPEVDQENKISDMRKMERNKSKSIKSKGAGGASVIPGRFVDNNSSEDMKAHIKFWARAVASNVRQECS